LSGDVILKSEASTVNKTFLVCSTRDNWSKLRVHAENSWDLYQNGLQHSIVSFNNCQQLSTEYHLNSFFSNSIGYVTHGPRIRRLSGIIYRDTSKNRREEFSSLKFFISAGVLKFVIIW